jgi:5-amino-6-(5-phosphoribosylamino)uracil reductase
MVPDREPPSREPVSGSGPGARSGAADLWPRRFLQFVARKEAEARAAVLQPFATEFERREADEIAIGSPWTRRLYDGDFHLSSMQPDPALPQASLVFVQSRDGNTAAADPSALGGGETDKHLIYEGLSRVAADAVLAGAETVRGGAIVFSTWHPEIVRLRAGLGLPRHPVQIVATLRGLAFDDTLLYNVPELRVIVLTVPGYAREMERDLAARPWITPLVMPHATDLRAAFAQLRLLGVERISVVGGRTLARSLVGARLIQDLYLTTSPKPGGEPNTPLFDEPAPMRAVARKHGTGTEAGVVFEHYRF